MAIFEFIIFLVGFSLICLSASLSKGKQEIVNTKIDKFWESFFAKKETDIIKSTADLSMSFIDRIYGKHILRSSIIISLSLFFILLFLFGGFSQIEEFIFNIYLLFITVIFVLPVNALLDFISFKLTYYLLSHIKNSPNIIVIIFFFILEFVIGIILFFIPVIVVSAFNEGGIEKASQGINELLRVMIEFFTTGLCPKKYAEH